MPGDEDVLEAALRVPPQEREPLIRAVCEDSARARRLVAVARSAAALTTTCGGSRRSVRALLPAGTRVSRYVVIEPIASGGMGTVYCAFDLGLQRRVALKIPDGVVGRVREQVLREARLLASVPHPNVVTVFDVGVDAGRPYIAMELVVGQTLRQWLAAPRTWRDVVRLLVLAGRGLEAAHRAGVVHRDMKPHNILVEETGRRVLVTDFGIAWQPAHSRGAKPCGGTLRYMAPEQRSGADEGVATDIYDFCAVLAEALPAAAPRWVRRIARRGLKADPAARWADMSSLVAALAGGLRRRALAWVGVPALLVGILAAWAWAGEPAAAPPADTCLDAIDLTATDAAVDRARAALHGLPGAGDSSQRTFARQQVDRAAADVHALNGETVCITQLRAACRDQAAARLQAAVEAIELHRDAPAAQIWQSAASVHQPCALSPAVELSLDRRRGLELALARAHQAGVRGDPGAARAGLGSAVRIADETGDDAVAAETRLRGAAILLEVADARGASAMASEAAWRASAAGLPELATRAALKVAYGTGLHQLHPAEGRRWLLRAQEMAPARSRPQLTARLLAAAALSSRSAGDFVGAEIEMRAAAAIRRAIAPDEPETAQTVAAVATMLVHQARYVEGYALFDEAVASLERSLHPEHPALGVVLYGRAACSLGLGELSAAEAGARRVLALERAAHGDRWPMLAADYAMLGKTLARRGHVEASAEAWCAAERVSASLPDAHPVVIDVIINSIAGGRCRSAAQAPA